MPESIKFGIKTGHWGHQYFDTPADDPLRHVIGSFLTAEAYPASVIFITSGNEGLGFLQFDIRNINSRLNGNSTWAFQWSDIYNNSVGITMWKLWKMNQTKK